MAKRDSYYWLFPVKIRTTKDEWNGRSSDELYELESHEHFLYEVQVYEIAPDEQKLYGEYEEAKKKAEPLLRELKELSKGFNSGYEFPEIRTSRILFKEEKNLIGTVDINEDEYRRLTRDYIVVCNGKETKGYIRKPDIDKWSFLWEQLRSCYHNPEIRTITGVVEKRYSEDVDLCKEIMDAIFDLG